jgi:hypothetical protein
MRKGGTLGVYEVYYDETGKPDTSTENPIVAVDEKEGVDAILEVLETIKNDVIKCREDILSYIDFSQD